MQVLTVENRCSDYSTYRAARVKSLFNAESGCNFDAKIEVPDDATEYKIGVIVGPSGSGKTSAGKLLHGGGAIYQPVWPDDVPIIDAIGPSADFNDVTGALAAVGLGTVPSWMRPYSVLSNGEKFRADLARVLCERPAAVVIDEFTSVVDRQIAKMGALAFSKAWKRGPGKCVLLTCHYDVLEWIEPDWVTDTRTGQMSTVALRRPKFDLEIYETNWRYWPIFEPHHYLKAPLMVAAKCYVGFVGDEPVCHVGFGTRQGMSEARACRLVVMPEWQGAGVGMRFLNACCQAWLEGKNRFKKCLRTLFHTSHPGLCDALRRDKKWVQVSGAMCGGNRAKSMASIRASSIRAGGSYHSAGGYGGHLRAIQGFRFMGDRKIEGGG